MKKQKVMKIIFGAIFILSFVPLLWAVVCCAYDTVANFTYDSNGCYSSSWHYFASTLTWQVLAYSFSPPVFLLCFLYQMVYIVSSIVLKVKEKINKRKAVNISE